MALPWPARLTYRSRCFGIEMVSVDATHVAAARQAFRLSGKGRHPAGLNFGDCFAYALARLWVAPLLFVGDDFAKTDIVVAGRATGRSSQRFGNTLHSRRRPYGAAVSPRATNPNRVSHADDRF